MHPDEKDDDRRITYFAATHTRGKREMFGIRANDRGKHIYVIGKTGMGKATMLENMAIQDIQNGEGIAFIDPHGSTAERLLDFVPHERIKDVVYFAPFDTDYPLGFNVMEDVGYDKRHLVVSGLMGALKRIWVDAWSARMEYILQNTLLALLEYPDSTLLDVNRMLTNKTFRNAVVEKITDPIVKSFWTEEFAAFTDTYTREATPAIQNKVGQFTANPLIRNIVGQSRSTFDLRKMMDEKKIFIVNLSKGRMGETNAALLGSMLVVKIYLAAMSRADEPVARMARLPRFYFYVDEFQSMMNEAFADILSESRKYKLALTLANQYIEQMEEEVRDAVFGNVGTLIVFRVGPFDAEVLETVFDPTFTPEDLVGLGIGQIYLTLMIDGVGSAPFSAETIPPIELPPISYRDDCVTNSRAQFSKPRAEMEALITKRLQEHATPPKPARPNDFGRSGGQPRREGFAHGGQGGERGRSSAPLSSSSNRDRADSPRNDRPRRDYRSTEPVRPFRDAPRHSSPPPLPAAPERSALRAAIDAARTEPQAAPIHSPAAPTSTFQNIDGGEQRSPAEILRARLARKATPEGLAARDARKSPVPIAAAPRGTEEFARPPQAIEKPEPDIPEDTGEVAPDTLQKVLHMSDEELDRG